MVQPSGGESDTSATSAISIPTLDGQGADGGLAHNPGVFIELVYLQTRVVLVMG
jgi:glutamate carboxypeptidase